MGTQITETLLLVRPVHGPPCSWSPRGLQDPRRASPKSTTSPLHLLPQVQWSRSSSLPHKCCQTPIRLMTITFATQSRRIHVVADLVARPRPTGRPTLKKATQRPTLKTEESDSDDRQRRPTATTDSDDRQRRPTLKHRRPKTEDTRPTATTDPGPMASDGSQIAALATTAASSRKAPAHHTTSLHSAPVQCRIPPGTCTFLSLGRQSTNTNTNTIPKRWNDAWQECRRASPTGTQITETLRWSHPVHGPPCSWSPEDLRTPKSISGGAQPRPHLLPT
jgi:hypothetical protein